jgi:hypothetical protein
MGDAETVPPESPGLPDAPEQMPLLDESMLPLRPDVEELVRAKSCVGKKPFTYSGKIVLRRVM